MRRKSKAKRVLDYESEEDEDGAQKVDVSFVRVAYCHNMF